MCNFAKWHYTDHLCKIIMSLGQWLRRSFSIIRFGSHFAQWIRTICAILVEGMVKNIFLLNHFAFWPVVHYWKLYMFSILSSSSILILFSGLTLCIWETPKQVLLQIVKTQMNCSIMLHFIKVYTICKVKKIMISDRIQYFFVIMT